MSILYSPSPISINIKMIAFYQQRLVVSKMTISLEFYLASSSIIFCSGDFDILNGVLPQSSYFS
jgi:hypothetical protein